MQISKVFFYENLLWKRSRNVKWILLLLLHTVLTGTECYGQDFVDESFLESRGEDSDSNDDLENGYPDIESPENAENEKSKIVEESNISNDTKKDK